MDEGVNDLDFILQDMHVFIREGAITRNYQIDFETPLRTTLQSNNYSENMGSTHTVNTESSDDNSPEASNNNQEEINSKFEDNDDVIFIDSRKPETQASNDPNNHIVSTTNVSDDVIFVGSVSPTIIDLSTPTDDNKRNQCKKKLKQRVVRRLKPLHDSNEKNKKKSSILSTCSICLEDPFIRNPTSTICGHIFCRECIKRAVKHSKKCPNCQQKLGLNSMHPIYI